MSIRTIVFMIAMVWCLFATGNAFALNDVLKLDSKISGVPFNDDYYAGHYGFDYLEPYNSPAAEDSYVVTDTPTDYRLNKKVTIRTRQSVKTASDRLLETETLRVKHEDGINTVDCIVQAGAVRIIELK